MSGLRVLISGDYWHHEFQGIVADFPTPVMLTPIDRLESELGQCFDLIVLAQSRPDQIPAELVERVQSTQPTTPVVALLGSWCEGGMRSDVPWPGVRRIYWHQWAGRFDRFSRQLEANGVTLWHQPLTASDADDALSCNETNHEASPELLVAISAADQTQFEHLRDVIDPFGWQACWAERASFDQETVDMVSAVCVDANSFSEDLVSRIDWLQRKLAGKPTSIVMNFPRTQDVATAAHYGVHDIVSKPFQPHDLKRAIESSIEGHAPAGARDSSVPAPHQMGATYRTQT